MPFSSIDLNALDGLFVAGGGSLSFDIRGTLVSVGGGTKPDATNTGYDGSLTASSSINMTTSWLASNAANKDTANVGTVDVPWIVENLDVSGIVRVQASNVTFRNSRVVASSTPAYCVWANQTDASGNAYTNIVLEDLELTGSSAAPLIARNAVATRLYIHDSPADGVKLLSGTTIQDSYITKVGQGTNSHGDGIQVSSASNCIIRRNTIDVPYTDGGDAAIFMSPDFGNVDNVDVYENWLNGGKFTIYVVGGDFASDCTNCNVYGNLFGRDYQYGTKQFDGATNTWGSPDPNIWEDTGEVIP